MIQTLDVTRLYKKHKKIIISSLDSEVGEATEGAATTSNITFSGRCALSLANKFS